MQRIAGNTTIAVYTDGGARGNPGPAALGVVFKDSSGRTIGGYGEHLGTATNNEAEYQAVVFALQKLKALAGKDAAKSISVAVHLDSELVARQLGGSYKINEDRLVPFFIKIWNARLDFKSVEFRHIPREENKEADRLVNEALDRAGGRQLFS